MPLNLQWTEPNPALGPTYGLEYYAGIIAHYGMILAAIGIVAGFVYMYMLHDPESKQKGTKIVLGSAIALVFLAFLPTLIDGFLVPSGSSFGIFPQSTGGWGTPKTGSLPPPSNDWLGNLLTGALGFILGSVVRAILILATALLQATLFHTYSLVDGGQFAQTVWGFYKVTAPIATGILAIILAYSFSKQAVGGSLLETGHTFDSSNLDPRILIPRAIAATLMSWCGFYVVGFILEVSNYMVHFFLDQSYNSLLKNLLESLGSGLEGAGATLALGPIWAFLWPLILLALLGLIIWIVVTYFVRLFEITFLTALLPIASAFWTMNETSNIWNAYIAEILGAIFVQPLQVFLWWVVVSLIVGTGLGGTGIAGGISNFFEGLVGIYFVATAPAILRNFIGHNVAGGSLTGQILEAVGVRSAVKNAWKASPASSLFDKAQDSVRQQSQQTVRKWGTQSIKPSLLDKPLGGVGRAVGGMAANVANLADGFRGGMGAGGGAFAEGGPMGLRFTRAARAAYGGVLKGSIDVGRRERYGDAGAAAANFRPTTAAGRIFAHMERRGGLAESQNELARAERLEEVPRIAQNQYDARVTREKADSDAMLQRPDVKFKEQMSHQQKINAGLNVWTGKSEGTDGTNYAQELNRARDENRGLFKERRQVGRRYRGEVGQMRMSQGSRQADRDISNTIKQNNALYQLITSKNPPGKYWS